MVVVDGVAVPAGPMTLVGAIVENDRSGPRRVTLRARTDGAILPPRRHAIRRADWDGDEIVFDLAAGERRAVGFATDGEPIDRPVAVEAVCHPPEGHDADGGGHQSPDAVVESLGDSAPSRGLEAECRGDGPSTPGATMGRSVTPGEQPRRPDRRGPGAVPAPRPDQIHAVQTGGPGQSAEAGGAPSRSRPVDDADDGQQDGDREQAIESVGTAATTTADGARTTMSHAPEMAESGAMAAPSERLAAALEDIADRVERGERLAASDDLATAADRLAEIGGLDAAGELADALDRDAARLAALGRRLDELGERAAAVEIPLETFRRLG